MTPAATSSNWFQYENRRESREFFSPAPTCATRRATAPSAIFNLVSTIIGGGVLSLPFAFAHAGLLVAPILMACAAVASDFTLYLLVSCSRRAGAKSYDAIARKAFGPAAQILTMILVILLTFGTLVGYVVLIRDLVGALGQVTDIRSKNQLTIFTLILVSPLLAFRSMNALRFTSILSLVSIAVLVVVIGVRAVQAIEKDPVKDYHHDIQWNAKSLADAIYVFPMISVAFLCHFNVLPVYGELHKPTRKRLKKIVHATMGSTWGFYLLVGVLGYLYGFRQVPNGVQDDILNNFSNTDSLIGVGRAGLTLTLTLSLPLLLLPCRETIYRTCVMITTCRRTYSDETTRPLLDDVDGESERVASREDKMSDGVHYLLTICIMSSAAVLGFAVPGVSVVWSVMGSTVGLLIAYVIPTACYLRIRNTKPHTDTRKAAAWTLLVISLMALCICSKQAFQKLFSI